MPSIVIDQTLFGTKVIWYEDSKEFGQMRHVGIIRGACMDGNKPQFIIQRQKEWITKYIQDVVQA